MTILSEGVFWGPVAGSLLNLLAISTSRYLKVVHPIRSQRMMRRWMPYAATAFPWIARNGVVAAVIIPTTEVVNGVCYSQVSFASRADQIAYLTFNLSGCVILSLILFFCYWLILVAVRRQASVMASYRDPGPSTSQTRSHRIQTNVIKTMVLVCAFYSVTTTPLNVYYLFVIFDTTFTLLDRS